MFYIHTKTGAVFKGVIYNHNEEKLEDALRINRELENEGRLIITGDDEVVIKLPSDNIKLVVKEKTPQPEELTDLPF
ncbi:hypothetical protein V7266_29435 [Neobacillus drentensis]|uniref:hypothetical protein n=1 Tax=Neobacillus drentensis TaxID=220684 RepID=UPI002FFE3116